MLAERAATLTLAWNERRYDAFCAEAWPLIRAHWHEVGSFRDVLELHPDHQRYRNLEAMGALHILTARENGHLVGYFIVLLVPHARDREALVGSFDALYVLPHTRARRLGIRLQQEGMRKLEALGAHILMFGERFSHSGKPGRRGGYLKRWGFVPLETMYGRVVKRPHARGANP